MLLSAFAASLRPCRAEALTNVSLMPATPVTTQALNFELADALTVVAATPTVSVPRTSAPAPNKGPRPRNLPIFSPSCTDNPSKGFPAHAVPPRHGCVDVQLLVTGETSPERQHARGR